MMIKNKEENYINTNEDRTQRVIAFTLAYLVSVLALLNCTNAITNYYGISTGMDTVVCYIILIASVILGYYRILISYKLKVDTILMPLGLMFMYLVTYFLFPNNRMFMFSGLQDITANPMYILFIYSLSGYFIARYVMHCKYIYTYFKVFSYIVVIMSVFVYFFIKDSFATQYMTLSYNMLLQVLFLIDNPSRKNKLLHYIIVGLGSFVIIIGGARGALVGIIVYFILKVCSRNIRDKKNIILVFMLMFGCILIFMFHVELLNMIFRLLQHLGVESRTLTLMILKTEQDVTTGRLDLYNEIINEFNLLGYGLYGDRAILGRYVHNLFLEWIIEFGIIGGSLIIVAFAITFTRGLVNINSQFWKYIVVFIPNGFIALLFSNSYLLQVPSFYILLGLCVNSIREKQKRKNRNIIYR